MIPSMDDIQNLQTIARVPEVYCSPEVQDILQPLLLIPPLRLAIELLNIPTVEEDVTSMCKGVDTSSIEKSVVAMATPDISVIPGGILNQAAQASAKAQEIAEAAANPEKLLEKASEKVEKAVTNKKKNLEKNLEKVVRKTRKNIKTKD
jgi:hypothetical protein